MSQRRKPAQKILPDLPATGNAVRRAFVSLFIAVLVVAVYAQVANFDFVNFDDPRYVTENPNVKAGLTANGVVWAFSAIYAGNWHPLTWLSHMTDVHLFGLNAGAHHSVNLVLHAANAVLLFLLLSSMTGALWRPAFCAALFAVHPLHVESVAWVAERKDVLCGFFWMLTMTAYVGYVRRPSSLRYLATFLSFAAALAAKPMAVTLPLVLWLLDFWPLRRLPDGRVGNQSLPDGAGGRPGRKRSEKVRQEAVPDGDLPAPPAVSAARIFWEKIPLLALSLASGLVTLYAQSQAGAVGALQHFPLADRLVNASVAYGKYLIMTVWPVFLSAFYPYVKDQPLHYAAVSLCIIAAATFAALYWRRRFPHFAVGWLWYLITLLPVIGIVQVGSQSMADRYTYLPLVGIFIGVCWGITDLAGRGRNRARVIAAAACASIAVFSVVSWQQAGYWRNSISLFSHALEVTAENAVARSNLSTALTGEIQFQIVENLVGRGQVDFRPDLIGNPVCRRLLVRIGVADRRLDVELLHRLDAGKELIEPDVIAVVAVAAFRCDRARRSNRIAHADLIRVLVAHQHQGRVNGFVQGKFTEQPRLFLRRVGSVVAAAVGKHTTHVHRRQVNVCHKVETGLFEFDVLRHRHGGTLFVLRPVSCGVQALRLKIDRSHLHLHVGIEDVEFPDIGSPGQLPHSGHSGTSDRRRRF